MNLVIYNSIDLFVKSYFPSLF